MILPLQDKILCRRKKQEQVGLIALPDNYISYEPYYAEVLEVGPGKVNVLVDSKTDELPSVRVKGFSKAQVKKGDTVLVKQNTQYEVKINGEWLYFIREQDVLGVVE
jgi:co-chaperonin GroES (HSP10)